MSEQYVFTHINTSAMLKHANEDKMKHLTLTFKDKHGEEQVIQVDEELLGRHANVINTKNSSKREYAISLRNVKMDDFSYDVNITGLENYGTESFDMYVEVVNRMDDQVIDDFEYKLELSF